LTASEAASFEVERFELGGDSCLEVHGRWFGVRGRRFMRPALTTVTDGRKQRLLAVLDHKPWAAEEGETWLAVFPWTADADMLGETELTVAPDLTVALPPPSSSARGARPRRSRARDPVSGAAKPRRAPALDPAESDSGLLAELDAVKLDRDRLREDLREALAARDEGIEAEVALRIAGLRAEAERDRAAAGLGAQTTRERDEARDARDEATRERDAARAERDAALRERNRMLAERDTAQTRVEEATRKWEAAATRGTLRTHERDALTSERNQLARERDSLTSERDGLLAARDQLALEHDARASERDELAGARDHLTVERDALAKRLDEMTAAHDTLGSGREPAASRPDRPPAPRDAPTPRREPLLREDRAAAPRSPARAATLRSSQTPATESLHRPTPHPLGSADASEVWRARLLAATALVVALIVLLVLLLGG
jgi:hypothetical protein